MLYTSSPTGKPWTYACIRLYMPIIHMCAYVGLSPRSLFATSNNLEGSMPQATGDKGGLKAITLASLSWMVVPMERKVLGVLPTPRVVAWLDLRAVVDAAAVERLEADHRQKPDRDRLCQVVACNFHGLQPPIA